MTKLSDCVEILDRKRIPLSSKQREKLEKIYPYFGAQGIIDYVDDYIFDGEYILVAEDGNNLKTLSENIAILAKGKFWVNNHAHILGKKDGFDLKYIYYLLNTLDLRGYVTGSAQPKLSQENLSNIILTFPVYEIQKAISTFLNSIDEKIEKNSKINTELESMAKTLFDYWFLQFEFPNEEGKPYKSSGGKMAWNKDLKKEIPEGWKTEKIGEIITEAKKSTIQVNESKDKGKFPFFTSGEGIFGFDQYFVDGFNLFLNTGGNPDIKAYYGKCAYSTDTWCISAEEYSFFLYYYLLKFLQQFEQLFFTGSGLKHLQKDAFKNIYTLLPKIDILKAFNEFCLSIWKLRTNQLIQNLELASLRDFLLPMLMNGQVYFK